MGILDFMSKNPQGLARTDQNINYQRMPARFTLPPQGNSLKADNLPIWTQGRGPQYQPTPIPQNRHTQTRVGLANSLWGWTPGFRRAVDAANPNVQDSMIQVGAALKGGMAGGTYSPIGAGGPAFIQSNHNPIALRDKLAISPGSDSPETITHEGLHAVFEHNPRARADFAKAYNSSANTLVKRYLQYATGTYATAQAPSAFNNFESLNPSMQTEAHSHLSAIADILPPALKQYYSRYFNTAQSRRGDQQYFDGNSRILDAVGRPGQAGLYKNRALYGSRWMLPQTEQEN